MQMKLSMALRGYPWLSVGIRGSPWLSVGIRGSPWLSVGICGNPWVSVQCGGVHRHLLQVPARSTGESTEEYTEESTGEYMCLVTLEWQAKSWEQRADIDTFEGERLEGAKAYAFEQAAVRRKIASRFASLWSGEMAILREFKPDNLDLEPFFKDLPRPPNRNADEVIEDEDIEAEEEDLAGEGEDEEPVLDKDEDEELDEDEDEEDQEDGLGSEPDEQMFGDEERSSSPGSSDGSEEEDEVENLTLKEMLTALEEEGDF
ncbi:hypothetical protein K435DRAFT_809014 [Dendrothele bispora CBS 962.96]|uniref:Uncharacterized protein n=1 Tax=Dendrothele bispora (strain CBS 962.96) TaxID=1314807 RepID=A0A4S8KZN0_DENBC|nr:hypothetical protein K435DRAFT_809014 [Dendrothele bispora CBS 962.96]